MSAIVARRLRAPDAVGLRGFQCGRKPITLSYRSYAATSPVKDTPVGKLDSDLWKSYNASLRKYIFQGKDLDKAKQVFYTAPIGALAIPAGKNIPQPITNMGVYQTGDTLLDLSNPLFVPGTGSYVQRQSRYLTSVQLKKNTNAGAAIRLQNAEKKQEDLQTKMDALKAKAKEGFDADESKPANITLRQWVSKNYPQYESVSAELQAAASATAAASIEVYGPGAKDLNKRISNLEKAQNDDESFPGCNMPVSDQQANAIEVTTLDANALPQFRPTYTIDAGYLDAMKQWMANSASDSGTAKKTTIDINLNNSSKESWEDSGFSKTTTSVSGGYWFITARVDASASAKEEHLSAEQLGSGISVRLSAAGIKSFNIKAGAWDGDYTSLYSPKDVSFLSNFSLPAAAAVSQVIVGYNVSLDISLSSSAAKQVSDLYEKTLKVGGSLSFFGIPIDLGGGASHESSNSTKYSITKNSNSFSSFSIAGEDSGHGVVLGVVGRKLPQIGK